MLLGSITGATVMLFFFFKGSLVEEASLALIQQSGQIVEQTVVALC